MKIKLQIEAQVKPLNLEVDSPITIEQLVKKYEKGREYRVIAARMDNVTVSLTETADRDCSIEFLDRRSHAANLIYQHGLSLIYLKAIQDVLGDIPVEIQNAINKGLYTEVKTKKAITQAQVQAIEKRMRQLVKEDIPIVEETPQYYSLQGCKRFFYDLMVPSTGYIEYFQLRKYRRGVIVSFPPSGSPSTLPKPVDEKRLSTVFGEAKKWNKLLQVNYLPDLNEKIRNDQYKELILLSEALHEKKIAQIADRITKGKKRIVLIAGPSSSGKTTFAQRLCIQLKVNGLIPLYLGTDDYFVERIQTPLGEDGEPDYEGLGALDIQLFNNNMNSLLKGKTVDLPTFDFLQGKKEYGKRFTSIKPHQPIVIEGIHALNGKLTEQISEEEKFRIYISPFIHLNLDSHNRISTSDARMLRRMVRDHLYRGHSAQMTINLWPKVRRGEEKNIFPFNEEADVLFNSALTYELGIMKKHVQPLLASIKTQEPEYGEAVRLLQLSQYFETIEDQTIIPANSILREFIGGSIFTD